MLGIMSIFSATLQYKCMFPAVWAPCLAQCCRFLTIIEWECVLLQNIWMERERKKKKGRAAMSDVVQNPLAVWASGQDMPCFWIWEQQVVSRVAVTSQTLACLDLSFSDLSFLKRTLGSVVSPLTLESRANLTDNTGNLWVFFFVSCRLIFRPELTKLAAFTTQNEVYTCYWPSPAPLLIPHCFYFNLLRHIVPYILFPAGFMLFTRVHLQHNAHWQLTCEQLNNWWSVERKCLLGRCVLGHLYDKTRI